MKKIMKKFFLGGVLCLLLVSILGVNTFATYRGFSGSAGYDYAKVSPVNRKDTTDTLMGIRWVSSDKGIHKMWFDCRSPGGISSSKLLIDWATSTTKYQNARAVKGYDYYLYASREHIINPSTYIAGTWQL